MPSLLSNLAYRHYLRTTRADCPAATDVARFYACDVALRKPNGAFRSAAPAGRGEAPSMPLPWPVRQALAAPAQRTFLAACDAYVRAAPDVHSPDYAGAWRATRVASFYALQVYA